jgi:hypothetical protein
MGISYETKISILGFEGGRNFAEAYIHFCRFGVGGRVVSGLVRVAIV